MNYTFSKLKSKVVQYPGVAGWHFLAVPKTVSADIKQRFGSMRRGWGSLPVEADLGKTVWETSIFPDAKSGVYLLPLKAQVRKKEAIYAGDYVEFALTVLDT